MQIDTKLIPYYALLLILGIITLIFILRAIPGKIDRKFKRLAPIIVGLISMNLLSINYFSSYLDYIENNEYVSLFTDNANKILNIVGLSSVNGLSTYGLYHLYTNRRYFRLKKHTTKIIIAISVIILIILYKTLKINNFFTFTY